MKPITELKVVSSFADFMSSRNIFTKALWWLRAKKSFESVLIKVGPKMHSGFYQQSLDLIISKD